MTNTQSTTAAGVADTKALAATLREVLAKRKARISNTTALEAVSQLLSGQEWNRLQCALGKSTAPAQPAPELLSMAAHRDQIECMLEYNLRACRGDSESLDRAEAAYEAVMDVLNLVAPPAPKTFDSERAKLQDLTNGFQALKDKKIGNFEAVHPSMPRQYLRDITARVMDEVADLNRGDSTQPNEQMLEAARKSFEAHLTALARDWAPVETLIEEGADVLAATGASTSEVEEFRGQLAYSASVSHWTRGNVGTVCQEEMERTKKELTEAIQRRVAFQPTPVGSFKHWTIARTSAECTIDRRYVPMFIYSVDEAERPVALDICTSYTEAQMVIDKKLSDIDDDRGALVPVPTPDTDLRALGGETWELYTAETEDWPSDDGFICVVARGDAGIHVYAPHPFVCHGDAINWAYTQINYDPMTVAFYFNT